MLGVFAVFDCGGAGLLTFSAFVSPRPPVQLGMSIMILLLKISYIKYLFLTFVVRCVGIARLFNDVFDTSGFIKLPILDTARSFAGSGACLG